MSTYLTLSPFSNRMYENVELSEDGNQFHIYDIKNVPLLYEEALISQFDVFNMMTSLGTFMLITHKERNLCSTSHCEQQTLSLAYEKLRTIPKLLIRELGPIIKHLDLSYNEFHTLNFLVEFKELSTLICDHNDINSDTTLPFLPNLELLWMNYCKINSLYPWARKLQRSCPNLRYLSLMGNPAAPSYLNGGTFYEYLQYRLFMISLFPKLIYFDDRPVTEDQRFEAQKMYKRPFFEKLTLMSSSNSCIRTVTDRFTTLFTNVSGPFNQQGRNCIV